MEHYFAVLSVVGLQRFVHPVGAVLLNILLEHRVPVNQEPAGHIYTFG